MFPRYTVVLSITECLLYLCAYLLCYTLQICCFILFLRFYHLAWNRCLKISLLGEIQLIYTVHFFPMLNKLTANIANIRGTSANTLYVRAKIRVQLTGCKNVCSTSVFTFISIISIPHKIKKSCVYSYISWIRHRCVRCYTHKHRKKPCGTLKLGLKK